MPPAAALGGGARRVSGLQHEVFALYRAILRAARRKDPGTYELARAHFRADAASVKRNDFQKIEFLLRHGRKQLRYLEMPGFVRSTSMTPPGGQGSSAS